MDKGILFLNAVVGEKGAKALSKALERVPELASVLVPRTVVAWLSKLDEYDGTIPGVQDSHLTLIKSEGSFSGVVTMDDDVYVFTGEPLHRAAAGLAVALGARHMNLNVDRANLARLAKSIDGLVKTLKLVPKPPGEDDGLCGAVMPAPYSHLRCTKPKGHGRDSLGQREHGAFDPELQGKNRYWVSPKTQLEVIKTELPGKAAAPRGPEEPEAPEAPKKMPSNRRGINLTKTDLAATCPTCGEREFADNKFVGCACLKGLSKSVRVTQRGNQLQLSFAPDLTLEDISAILEVVKDD